MKINNEEIGFIIRTNREALNLTLEELALKSNVHRLWIGKVENNKVEKINITKLNKILKVLDIPTIDTSIEASRNSFNLNEVTVEELVSELVKRNFKVTLQNM